MDFLDCNVHKSLSYFHEGSARTKSAFKLFSQHLHSVAMLDIEKNVSNNSSFQVIEISQSSSLLTRLSRALSIMSNSPTRSTLVLAWFEFNDLDWNQFREAVQAANQTSFFFLAHISHMQNKLKWHQVLTLEGHSTVAISALTFVVKSMCIEESFDLQGLPVVNFDLDWKPYIFYEGCNPEELLCDANGALPETLRFLGSQYNFSFHSVVEPSNRWGGLPNATTGIWGGAMGSVVHGESDMTLGMWMYNRQRFDVLDFVPCYLDIGILAMAVTKPRGIDLTLFLRPFTNVSWIVIWCSLGVLFAILAVPQFVIPQFHLEQAELVLSTTAWYFFVLMNTYYGGALTMFFATEDSVTFHSELDVVRAYPQFKLLVDEVTIAPYVLNANAGDEDWMKFKQRWEKKPEEVFYNGLANGVEKLTRDSSYIVSTNKGLLKGFYKQNPFFPLHLRLFGEQKQSFLGILLKKNSPLTTVLHHGMIELRETGKFNYILTKWEGKYDGSSILRNQETLPMKLSQMFTIFMFLVLAFGVTLIMLALEKCSACLRKRKRSTARKSNYM